MAGTKSLSEVFCFLGFEAGISPQINTFPASASFIAGLQVYAMLPIWPIIFLEFFKDLCLFHVCECFAFVYICMHTTCMPGPHRGQKRALDTLEVELQVVVSYRASAGNWTWVLCSSLANYLNDSVYSVEPGCMQRSPGKQNRHLRVKLGPCCAMYWFCLSPTQNSPFRALSPTLGLLCVWERLTPKLQAGNDKNGRPSVIGLLTGEDSTHP